MRVRFKTAAALLNQLIEARDERRRLRFQKHLPGREPLIIEELGFVPLSKSGAGILFEVFSQSHAAGRYTVRRSPASSGIGQQHLGFGQVTVQIHRPGEGRLGRGRVTQPKLSQRGDIETHRLA